MTAQLSVSSFLLVHSPLVGPTTWFWVAEELRRLGHDVIVPSLTDCAVSGEWQTCVDTVVGSAPADPAVLVAHSGAGPLVPAIASRLEPPPLHLVLVDAPLPPDSGEVALVPDEFLPSLRDLARGGVLPKWSEWFGPSTMETLVPDPHRRAAVEAELAVLPVSFFERRVLVPATWTETKATFILLSELYKPDAARARAWGWAVVEIPGGHLDIVTDPTKLADTLAVLGGD